MADIPPKTGRNDPCYCGSGKKYKKCHFPEDKAAERQRLSTAMAIKFLRQDLLKYARDDQFATAFAAALSLYWNELYTIDNAEEMSETEALRFFDWFIFDYQPETGPRLLDAYAEEKGPELSGEQQAVLDEWLQAPPAGGYELVGYEGQTLHLRDYLTDETVDVYAGNGRGSVEVGEVILARILPQQGQKQFSTTAAYLPAAEITDIKAKMLAAREAYQAEHPDASHEDFLRAHNHLYVHHALAEAERVGRPPVARLDPDRDDGTMREAARMLSRQFAGRRRRWQQ